MDASSIRIVSSRFIPFVEIASEREAAIFSGEAVLGRINYAAFTGRADLTEDSYQFDVIILTFDFKPDTMCLAARREKPRFGLLLISVLIFGIGFAFAAVTPNAWLSRLDGWADGRTSEARRPSFNHSIAALY
ncbi:hypothetical protein CWS72_09880 [Telmatospirillum siberiense]|uniref:Uncharacterized protein n=2 Tax=Telmatospirillum siberiense TaxID=382514 RepID=A0A2N3PW97_9PROT|nr:hypothetical protein CWS72_09880 [Telmatospirillum siberiense]